MSLRKIKPFIKVFFLSIIFLLLSLVLSLTAEAYQKTTKPDLEVNNAFTISPAKIEVNLSPGQQTIRSLTITNQTGHFLYLTFSKEDFVGSSNPEQATVFLGQQKGRFSLKDWLELEIEEFGLDHGEKITFAVKITIPEDAEPGGYYAAVFAASQPAPGQQTQVKVVSRLGSLFFVKVKGEVKEEGFLEEFKTDKSCYQKELISFEIISRNTGNVHLITYGLIEIRNIFGRKKAEIRLQPWFVMPDSRRLRKIIWQEEPFFGLYTATAKINRGYQNLVDEKTVRFWVISWKVFLAGLIGLFLIGFWVLRAQRRRTLGPKGPKVTQ